MLYLRKFNNNILKDNNKIEEIIKKIKAYGLLMFNNLLSDLSQDKINKKGIKFKLILENLLCHYSKRFSLSQLFSCYNFLEMFKDNIYKEIMKGNIKSK